MQSVIVELFIIHEEYFFPGGKSILLSASLSGQLMVSRIHGVQPLFLHIYIVLLEIGLNVLAIKLFLTIFCYSVLLLNLVVFKSFWRLNPLCTNLSIIA